VSRPIGTSNSRQVVVVLEQVVGDTTGQMSPLPTLPDLSDDNDRTETVGRMETTGRCGGMIDRTMVEDRQAEMRDRTMVAGRQAEMTDRQSGMIYLQSGMIDLQAVMTYRMMATGSQAGMTDSQADRLRV